MSHWNRVMASDCTSSAHVSRYESLRDQVLEDRITESRQGLTILLRQGMSAWIHTWSEVTPPVALREPGAVLSALPDGTSGEVVHLLAAMALEHMTQVRI